MEGVTVEASLRNLGFQSWRLGFSLVQRDRVARLRLPAPLALHTAGSDESAQSYLRTRSAILHNNLACCDGQMFVFLDEAEGVRLFRVQISAGGLSLEAVANLGCPAELAQSAGGLLLPPMCQTCCSVASASNRPKMLAGSSGNGDVTLIQQTDKGWRASNTITPLVAGVPLVGVKPFLLRAAVEVETGVVQLVIVTIFDKTDAIEAGCEISSLRIHCSPQFELTCSSSPHRLYVSGVQPHVVLVSRDASPGGAVLVGVTPGHSLQSNALQPTEAALDEHCGLGLAGSAAGMTVRGDEDGDDNDMDAELLAAARERLSHMTSEQQEDAAELQAADVFKEGGPEGLGEMGAEPACDLVLFGLSDDATEGGSDSGPNAPRLLAQLPLSPHRIVGAQAGLPGFGADQAIVGVTDDVDCAVLGVSVQASGAGNGASVQVKHQGTVPALSYIAAGKQQKKFLLLSTHRSPEPVCAALVESLKYAYIYGTTALSESSGVQQVVDLEKRGEETTLVGTVEGAQLLSGDGYQALVLLSREELLAVFFS